MTRHIPMAQSGTILHLAALLGITATQRLAGPQLIALLPFEPALSQALVAQATARGLLERRDDGIMALTLDGQRMLVGGDIEPLQAFARHRKARAMDADSLRQRAWNAMRLQQRFTVSGLVVLAARTEAAPAANIKIYVSALHKAGYLVVLPQRVKTPRGGPGSRQWRLLRDTGPLAPVHRVVSASVHDLNTAETHGLTGGRHAA